MTSPYVGAGYSWADQMAKRVPKQTDILDQTLGQRFGNPGSGVGQQSPQQASHVQPHPSMPTLNAGPTATDTPAMPRPAGTPPGSTPMTGGSQPATYTNPFRPQASPPITAPPAPPIQPVAPQAPPPATPTAPPPAPPQTPPQAGTHPETGNINWLFGANPDGSPSGPNGGRPIAGLDSSSNAPHGNGDGYSLISQAQAAAGNGDTSLANLINNASQQSGAAPGSPEWWAAIDRLALAQRGGAPTAGDTPSVPAPTPQPRHPGSPDTPIIPGMPPGIPHPRTGGGDGITPGVGMASLRIGGGPPEVGGQHEANSAFQGQAPGTAAHPPAGAPTIPWHGGSPFAPGWHDDLGYYVTIDGTTWDTTTHQQLPGSEIDRRNDAGPTAPTAPATPPIAPPPSVAPPPPMGTTSTFTPPSVPARSPNIPTNPLTSQAQGAASDWLNNPNPYTQDIIESLWNDKAGQIDSQFSGANRRLQGDLSRRGITDSTFGGEKQLELLGQERTAKESALASLMEDAAQANSASKAQAIASSMGLSQQEFNQYLAKWNAQEAAAGADWNRIMDVNASDQQSQIAWQQFLEWMYSQGRA